MDFLDKLILPQSAEHIKLLHYIITLVLSLFIPFISIIFGGTFLSIYYGKRFRKNSDLNYQKLSRDIIEYVTVNNGVGVILGLVPLLTSILLFAQIVHTAKIDTVSLIAIAFIFVTVAFVMIYTYRHSLAVSFVFNSVDSKKIQDKSAEEEFAKLKNSSSHLSLKYGRLGLVFLFIGIWFFIAGITSVELFTSWNYSSIFTALAAPKVLLNLLIFICFAFSLTAAAILFIYLYWKEDKENDSLHYKEFVKNKLSKLGLQFAIPLPLLIAINLLSLSDKNLSGSVFVYSLIAILLIFLSYHFFFMLKVKNEYKFSALIFFVLILASVSLIIKDQKAISNATKYHSLVLSTEYDKVLAELKGEGKVAAISGKEIYDVRCASCHKFNQKLVGPAHFDVLPKYVGKEAQLVAFIRNPVKVNPAFPPMPNPGLKPQEAEAVAKYLLDEFDKYEKSLKK